MKLATEHIVRLAGRWVTYELSILYIPAIVHLITPCSIM
jgi:putative effector of murein hydrolase LrgA (UPF0299 family)